ncbi:multicopper oxidase [Halalkalicoccus paucihalophilus]|uniref:Multicopper oxidase n=2 Tax=Halalkalicoccus paucihalophilus TaxID=1008153 RepID=A0A151AAU0_9EURY|nr:multicopper oxidase [Halalkalicoccus paucihalophilus]
MIGAGAAATTLSSAAKNVDLDEMVPETPDEGGKVRHFDVHAINVDIVYNAFGQHQPNGVMYVLEENLKAARRASGCAPGGDVDTSVLEPLVIRANEGDIVEIDFHNHLDCRASMHQYGLPYEVNESDGLAVGYNEDTTVAPDDSITYRWYANHQGTRFFGDGASPAMLSDPEEEFDDNNLQSRGLFGALAVESPEATWTDPKTGKKLESGVKADIHEPDGVSHREFVVCYHDAIDIVNADGSEPVWPGTDNPQSIHAINYRAATTSARLQDEEEETFYSSWVHGDPGGGDLVFPCYTGDPVKMSIVGAQHEENHVHHLHGHRWKSIPGETESDTIDSQTIGPTASFEARLTIAHGPGSISPDIEAEEAFETGAGNGENTGDYLFHCHMFPHYGEGMNGMMRVLDKEHKELQLLENSDPPLDADSEIEGFPEFIPNEDGELPPKPPGSQRNGREAEGAEAEALGDVVPGAPYQDPCDPEGFDPEVLGETREYTIVALPADVVYNDAGDHDPEGKVYVLEDDAEAVRSGKMNPEPLVIRANVGDCVEVTFKNELELGKSVHPHFVNFDPLGSDSANVGYNYDQGTDSNETMHYRWFANEEGTIFFHDHITGIPESQNGIFGAIIVEPEDSTWHDPHTGEEIESGTQAMINPKDGDAFREFALLYHDFAPLKNCDGEFINQQMEHNQNAGSGAINYRTAPYFRRTGDDPAYVHSSRLHGDPPTPTLETYAGDPVRIRLLQGPYEEQHNFGIHGIRGQADELRREATTSQIIGPSEAFSFDLLAEDTAADRLHDLPNPDGLPIWDHVYGSDIVQDLWEGMWGIFRLFDAEVEHLQTLPGSDAPDASISNEELREMGHPAPFSDFDWTEFGHKAKLLYAKNDDREFPPDKDARQNDSIGERPPVAPEPGEPCPAGAPDRTYNITAIQTEIEYNDYGDHDPYGIVYVLDNEVEAIRSGEKNPEPLTIRANIGDCVEINLTNALGDLDDDHAHPTFDIEPDADWDRSQRISLTTQNLLFDDQGSSGMAVGFNFDSTVAPGETMTYRWFADPAPVVEPGEEPEGARSLGTSVVSDFADVRSNRHHGAFGNMIVEPEGSEWLDPETGKPVLNSTQAMITNHEEEDFREFALMFTDGMYIVNDDGSCPIPRVGLADEEDVDVEELADEPCNQILEQEDQGFQGINYRSEPFARRFENDERQYKVYSSEVHGDPNTPLLRAYTEDPVTLRVSQPADRANGITFHCAGHQWRRNNVSEARLVGTQDDLSTGAARELVLDGGAGGVLGDTGDYVYQERKTKFYLEGGLWGLMRVQDAKKKFDQSVLPLPDRAAEFEDDSESRDSLGFGSDSDSEQLTVVDSLGHSKGD